MITAEKRSTPRIWRRRDLRQPHAHRDKARRVRSMFDHIAGTYELINTLASLGMDRRWRRRAVELAQLKPGQRVLDVACGTGDLARHMAASPAKPGVIGIDFAWRMLALAAGRLSPVRGWSQADAQALPFADGQFDVASCAFGVRNFQDLQGGLSEIHRVLFPGGRAVILEFSLPRNAALRLFYRTYFEFVMPMVATLLSRDRLGAYRYLPRSVVCFRNRGELTDLLRQVGFTHVTAHPLTLGIVVVYVAHKATHGPTG